MLARFLIDVAVALALIGLIRSLILIDQYRKEAKDNGAWGVFGDVPSIPDGLTAARRAGGEAQRRGGHEAAK